MYLFRLSQSFWWAEIPFGPPSQLAGLQKYVLFRILYLDAQILRHLEGPLSVSYRTPMNCRTISKHSSSAITAESTSTHASFFINLP
jgi:hypothetical protein